MSVQRGLVGDAIPTTLSGLLGIGLIVAITIQHTGLPSSISYITVLGVYLTIAVVFICFSEPVLVGKRFYIGLFFLLTVISVASTVLNPSTGTIIRLGALLLFTTANFFIVPQVIPLRQLFYLTSRVSVVFVGLGLFPYIGAPTKLWIFDVSTWGVGIYWLPTLEVIRSIFHNPNALGFFTLVGAFSAFGVWLSDRSRGALIVFVIATAGLALTNYRAGWIAFIIGFALAGVYRWRGRSTFVISLVSGLSLTLLLLLLLFGVLPGPASLTEISLNNRRELWTAGAYAVSTKPFFGHGLSYGGTHNSFIRIFAALGVGGGLVYLLLALTTTIQSARAVSSERDLVVVMALTGFLFIQLFAGFSFIGISLRSTFVALLMGYYITGTVNKE